MQAAQKNQRIIRGYEGNAGKYALDWCGSIISMTGASKQIFVVVIF